MTKMINKHSIILLRSWINEESVFIDDYTDTFMIEINSGSDKSEFYKIPPELTGLFSPKAFEENEHYSFCYGQLTTSKAKTTQFEPIPAKLYKMKSFDYFNYENHQNNLLSAISFASFHYRNISVYGIPYINQFIAISSALNFVGKINDENLLKAAVLCHIVNSTEVRIESVKMLFGEQVSMVVEILAFIQDGKNGSQESLLSKLDDASVGVKQVQLAILSTKFKYIGALE
jgi:hypothetical protein